MAGYKDRLTKDLDRWIGAGLIAGERRQAILDTIPDPRRFDAGMALAWVGTILLGAAAIAFVAANWDEMPRLMRFALVLAVFLGACGGAAWAARLGRRLVSNALLTFAALAFAAAIGLTGQIFDITGDPRSALYMAGAAAAALALAGGSTGAAAASLILLALGDAQEFPWFNWDRARYLTPATAIAAPLGALLAMRWRSAPLAHVSALCLIFAAAWIVTDPVGGSAIFVAALLALLAAGARLFRMRDHELGSVFYGWLVSGALAYYAAAGLDGATEAGHRAAWLLIAGGVVALGRYDRHALVTGAGVMSLIGAVTWLLVDLGLDLMTAAIVFFFCALAALVTSFLLNRKARA